ncbi:MAG: serine/threonine protein kinase [Pseudomonadota bacterium]
MATQSRQLLKRDTFGAVYLVTRGEVRIIERDIAAAPWWSRPTAAWLMRREARALGAVHSQDGFVQLHSVGATSLTRSFVPGEPMYVAKPRQRTYFKDAFARLRRLHRLNVTHNDLAKEPNWLVRPDGSAAIVDFQLARVFATRTASFRRQAREDLRHFLKHKRTYLPDALTARERQILATPGLASRIWMRTVKPVYLFVTRRLLNWSDREGAADRGKQ